MKPAQRRKRTLNVVLGVLFGIAIATYIARVGFTYDFKTLVSGLIGLIVSALAAMIVLRLLIKDRK